MEPIEQLFAQRARRGRMPYGLSGLALAVLFHLAIVAVVFVVPALLAQHQQPFDFVEVAVLPAAALAPGPEPEPEQVEQPSEPEPEPEPIEPEPDPVPEDVPTLAAEEPSDPQPTPDRRPTREPAETDRRGASTGTSETTSAASFDDPDFRFGYYADRMIEALRRHWRPPRVPDEVEMRVHFRILADGTIVDVETIKSSGIRAFDLAGLEAIERATLPRLPRGYQKESLGVTLVIRPSSRGGLTR